MSAAAEEEVPAYRTYSTKEGALRSGLSASALRHVAKYSLVECTRTGPKRRTIRWTEAQLAGAVAYYATTNQRRGPEPPPKPTQAAATPRQRGTFAPLEIKPGRRYGRAQTI